MTYQVVPTKGNVVKISDVVYDITINFAINDGTKDVLTTSITERYNTNTTNLDYFKTAVLLELKDQWDKYVAEKGIKDAAAFDTALSDMQTQATNYVNQ